MTQDREELKRDVRYWREAYESLVDQTGRDLNDGLGIDPRRASRPAKSGRTAAVPSLLSDLEAMQEALRPFAAFVDFERSLQAKSASIALVPDRTPFVRWAGAFGSPDILATYGDLRRARQALSKEPEA